jgi:hypothetical protein
VSLFVVLPVIFMIISSSHGVTYKGKPGICGGQSGAGAGFLRVLWFPLPIFIPPIAPKSPSSIIWGLYNRPEVAAVPSGLSPTPLIIIIIIIIIHIRGSRSVSCPPQGGVYCEGANVLSGAQQGFLFGVPFVKEMNKLN